MRFLSVMAKSSASRISFAGLLILTVQLVNGQGQAPPGGGGGGAGTTGGGAGNTGGGTGFPGGTTTTGRGQQQPTFPNPNDPRQQQQRFPEMDRPIFLSGKVVVDDGTPPPEPVTIERVCNGHPRPEGYTDSKGRFSFQLGQNQSAMMDASVGNDPGGFGGFDQQSSGRQSGMPGVGGGRRITERDLVGCEIRAVLPGYRSEAVPLAGRRTMDNPDIGTIILRRLGNVEGLTVSITSAAAPKDAKKAFDKGRELARKNKLPEAQKEFEKAVATYPKYANAWSDLGTVHEMQGHMDEARKAYTEALTADAKLVKPHVKMAYMWAKENKWKECAESSERAVKLNPFDFPEAYFYNAVANLNLQNIDVAEKSVREGIKLDSNNRIPKMKHVLGIILAQKQDYAGAAENMKGYLSLLPSDGAEAAAVKKQLADMEKFAQGNAQRQN